MTAPPAAVVEVWCLDAARMARYAPALARLLSTDERARAVHARDAGVGAWFTARRGLLRVVLGLRVGCAPERLRFAAAESGRPALAWPPRAQVAFSVSQARDLALVAVSAGASSLGIDVEAVDAELDVLPIAREVFSSAELQHLASGGARLLCDRFFTTWTRKEAFLKALGVGLRGDPRTVTIAARARGWEVIGHRGAGPWTLLDLPAASPWRAALAVSGADVSVTWKQESAVNALLAGVVEPTALP